MLVVQDFHLNRWKIFHYMTMPHFFLSVPNTGLLDCSPIFFFFLLATTNDVWRSMLIVESFRAYWCVSPGYILEWNSNYWCCLRVSHQCFHFPTWAQDRIALPVPLNLDLAIWLHWPMRCKKKGYMSLTGGSFKEPVSNLPFSPTAHAVLDDEALSASFLEWHNVELNPYPSNDGCGAWGRSKPWFKRLKLALFCYVTITFLSCLKYARGGSLH